MKYGKKGKPLSSCADLTRATLQLNSESRTKFKIVTVKSGTISLKAESVAEREQWVQAIKGMIGGGKRYLDRTEENG